MDFPPLIQGEGAGRRRRGNALVQGSGQRGRETDENCHDYLDHSLCGWVSESILPFLDGTPYYVEPCFRFLAKTGMCNLMNILAADHDDHDSVWVPCKATCGHCEWLN